MSAPSVKPGPDLCDLLAAPEPHEEGLEPLTPEELDALEAQLEIDPDACLEWLSHVRAHPLTLAEARVLLAAARARHEARHDPRAQVAAFALPAGVTAQQAAAPFMASHQAAAPFMASHQAAAPLMASQQTDASPQDPEGSSRLPFPPEHLPADFDFPGMDPVEIPIDPGETRFETAADWASWLIYSARAILPLPDSHPRDFRWHDAPAWRESRFIYPMVEPAPDRPLELALFSDFGTGLYPSRYIAKQLRERRFPYAIHLGDVYYAGTRLEFEQRFRVELDPMLPHTRLFTLPGNHEMFSWGAPFMEYIDFRREAFPGFQEQEGTYFCLRNERFQIIGIDTAWFSRPPVRRGEYKQAALKEWLRGRLTEGREAGRVNILLSPDHPYRYRQEDQTPLYDDLRELAGPDPGGEALVDLWFWGNTHYCALFDRSSRFPFIGSCIGHGGYPFLLHEQYLDEPLVHIPAEVLFLERRSRFPAWTGVRQHRGHVPGNNGYCVLRLQADGSLELRYIDWMSTLRCSVRLCRVDGRLEVDRASLQVED